MSTIGKEIKEWKNIDTESNNVEFEKIIHQLNEQKVDILKGGGDISI